MPEAFVQLPEDERVELTPDAKAQGIPLVERWRDLEYRSHRAPPTFLWLRTLR